MTAQRIDTTMSVKESNSGQSAASPSRSPRSPANSTASPRSPGAAPAARSFRAFFNPKGCSRFLTNANFEAQEVDFVELCSQFHPGKKSADLTCQEQVHLIRHALRKKDFFLIDPHCVFMKYFDLVMALALLYTGIVTPYEVIFMKTVSTDSWLFWVNRLVDSTFLVDITLQFFLKVEKFMPGTQGTVMVRDRTEIRKLYLKTWFPVDIVGIAPFDIVFIFVEGSEAFSGIKILRCLRLMRLAKLVRILRTSRLILRWQTHFAVSFASQKLVKFSFLMMLASHWMGCLWGLVGLMWGAPLCDDHGAPIERDIALEDTTWITTLFMGGKTSPDSPCEPWHVYMASLHWAVMTITSIGYGDIVPVRNVEYVVCVFCMLFGGVLWAYIIGSLCSIISHSDPVESKFETSTDLLNTMMRESGVARGKRLSYREYLREAKAYDTMLHFREVASQFSPQLKGELLLHVSQAWTKSVFYLKDAPERVLMELTEVLDLSFFARKEELQQHCNCLRLVERGTVASAGRILTRGDAFNTDFIVSNVLWRRFPRTMSLTYSMVTALERAQLLEICERWPRLSSGVRRAAAKIAMMRCMGMCAARSRVLSLAAQDGNSPPLGFVFHQLVSEEGKDNAGEPAEAAANAATADRDAVNGSTDSVSEPAATDAVAAANGSTAASDDLCDGSRDDDRPPYVPEEPGIGPLQPPPSSAPDTLRRQAAEAVPAPLGSRLAVLETGLEATLNLVQRQLLEVRALRQEVHRRGVGRGPAVGPQQTGSREQAPQHRSQWSGLLEGPQPAQPRDEPSE